VKQHELRAPKGSRRTGKRVGRGNGSKGNYSGKGMKGQQSRSGSTVRPGFEGGQLPMVLKLPTNRGFTNIFRTDYAVVNLSSLEERFESGADVTPEAMVRAGILRNLRMPVKVLANGEITKPLTVSAHRFSTQAREQLQSVGGTVQDLIGPKTREQADAGNGS
jgi:large subunit ribosomal protein L15